VIRLLADENFNNNIVRGVRLRDPDIDLVRVQDVFSATSMRVCQPLPLALK
jgi:hypothetical protein